MVMPSSTTRPSIWWKTGVCVASSSSVRKTLPGQTIVIGGSRRSISRICTGEVWVRSTSPESAGSRKKVSVSSRDGWSGGVLSASKFEPRGLDLRTLGDLVAHRDEDVLEPLHDRRERVPGADGTPVGRQRDVDRLLDQHPRVPLGGQLGGAGGERLLDLGERGADPLAGGLAGRRRQRADLPAGERHRRAVAGVRQPRRLQRVQVTRRRERRQRLGHGGVDGLWLQCGNFDRVEALVRHRRVTSFSATGRPESMGTRRTPVPAPGRRGIYRGPMGRQQPAGAAEGPERPAERQRPADPELLPLAELPHAGAPDGTERRSARTTWWFVAAAAAVVLVGGVLGVLLFNTAAPGPVRGAATAREAARSFVVAVNTGDAAAAVAASCDGFADDARSAARSGTQGIRFRLTAVRGISGTAARARVVERLALPGGRVQTHTTVLAVQRRSFRWLVCGRLAGG